MYLNRKDLYAILRSGGRTSSDYFRHITFLKKKILCIFFYPMNRSVARNAAKFFFFYTKTKIKLMKYVIFNDFSDSEPNYYYYCVAVTPNYIYRIICMYITKSVRATTISVISFRPIARQYFIIIFFIFSKFILKWYVPHDLTTIDNIV